MRSCVLAVVFLLLLPALAASQEPHADRVTSEINWTDGTLRVTVERPVAATGELGPAAVSKAQRAVRDDAREILLAVLSDLPFDSRDTVGTLIARDERLISALERAAARAKPVDASATPDLLTVRVSFVIDLYSDLGVEFFGHERAVPLESRLGWVPHEEYTGVLIYAAEQLPLFGTDTEARLEPTLFPGLYYVSEPQQRIYRLAEVEHFEPEALSSRGPVAYTSDVQATGLADRVGTRPLRILAVAAFGGRPTDIVVSEEDARQIMASEHNRELVRQGRVVVVLHPGRL